MMPVPMGNCPNPPTLSHPPCLCTSPPPPTHTHPCHREETICHPLVKDSTAGAGASSCEEPTTPVPTVYPSPRISQWKVLEPLGRDRKERSTIKEYLKCESL